ncbi:MAG: hypothetical protein KGI67_02215 [Pseudomonadota bacterium]|nr:hypothetical protein [Pseudomonadota bacterium]
MPFKKIADVFAFKTYVATLRKTLDAGIGARLDMWLFDDYAFDSQRAPLLLVGKVDNSLIVALKNDCKLLGVGECACDGKVLRFKAPPAVTEKAMREIMRISRLGIDVAAVKELEAPVLPGIEDAASDDQSDADATSGPLARSAEAFKKQADELAPPLILALDKVLQEFLPNDPQKAAVQTQRDRLAEAHDAHNADRVMTLVKPLSHLVGLADGMARKTRKDQDDYLKAKVAVEPLFKLIYANASDEDRLQLDPYPPRLDGFADRCAFANAQEALKAMTRRLGLVKQSTQVAFKEEFERAQNDTAALLPDPTRDEQDALQPVTGNWTQAIAGGVRDTVKAAADAYGLKREELVRARSQLARAQQLREQVERTWSQCEYKVDSKFANKVKGYLSSFDTEAKVANRIKNSERILKELSDAWQAAVAKNAQELLQAQQLTALLSQTESEDNAALAHGNGKCTGGLLPAVWSAVRKTRTDSPANGSISGVHALAAVEQAIRDWEAIPPLGILTNFHVPKHKPQAKWEKDYTRPVVQACMILNWRGKPVNIHVDVEPKSFIAKYSDDLDWTLVPAEKRKEWGGPPEEQ